MILKDDSSSTETLYCASLKSGLIFQQSVQSVSYFCSGLFSKFGELIEEHGSHGDVDFASRINLDLYMDNSKVCKRGKLI